MVEQEQASQIDFHNQLSLDESLARDFSIEHLQQDIDQFNQSGSEFAQDDESGNVQVQILLNNQMPLPDQSNENDEEEVKSIEILNEDSILGDRVI